MSDEKLIQWLRDNSSGIYRPSEEAADRLEELTCAIKKCLTENAHLADGEVCAMIDLKRAVPEWEDEFLSVESEGMETNNGGA